MATCRGKGQEISKVEYLKRYLDPGSAGTDDGPAKRKKKRRQKKPEGKGMRIVDDDVEDWKREPIRKEEPAEEEEDQPVVAEFVDERPEEVKYMEEFRNSNKWRLIRGDESPENSRSSDPESRGRMNTKSSSRKVGHISPVSSEVSPLWRRHDSPDSSPPRKSGSNSLDPSPPRKKRHESPDHSPLRRAWHKSPDASPHDSSGLSPPQNGQRKLLKYSPSRGDKGSSKKPSSQRNTKWDSTENFKEQRIGRNSPDVFSAHKVRRDSTDLSPPRRAKRDSPNPTPSHRSSWHSSESPKRKKNRSRKEFTECDQRRTVGQQNSDSSSLSPPRHSQHKGSDSDLSPPRRRNGSEKDGMPSQRGASSKMLSGGRAGLVPAEVLREEKEEQKRAQKDNRHLEDDSRNADTIFRDKSGKRRDLKSEHEQKKQEEAAQEKRNEMYARWGKGLAQQEQQRQNLEAAAREMEKPLARYIDDADLDRMLRDQEREGDPMAKFLNKKKEKESKNKKERPKYKGPNPPLNRFNILPGYRWDGVDRSNGFENQYFARKSEKKAVQESAYKWSIEDM